MPENLIACIASALSTARIVCLGDSPSTARFGASRRSIALEMAGLPVVYEGTGGSYCKRLVFFPRVWQSSYRRSPGHSEQVWKCGDSSR